MSVFLVTMRGNLLRRWPAGRQIKLLSCKFTQGSGPRDFEIQAEATAKDDNEAMQVGREMCSDAADLLEFCLGEQVFLNPREIHVKPQKGTKGTGLFNMGLHLEVTAGIPPSEEQMEIIKKVETIFDEKNDSERQELLARVIHWQASGRRETQSDIDRFLKFWIALEVLVGGAGKAVVGKIKKQLGSLYQDTDTQKVAELIGRIYGVRCDIFHFGVRRPQQLNMRLQQLEDIVRDLLRTRLGLEFKAFARQHLSES